MKVSELNQLIENIVSEEIKKTIIKESEGNKYEVYHITCEGEPLATFNTEDEAKEQLPKYKKSQKGELIIEKGVYESYGDMLEKLDQMGEQLEEKENTNMENQETMEQGSKYLKALFDARERGDETFEVDGETHNVKESWESLEEEESAMEGEQECEECGDMKEELHGDQDQIDMNKDGKIGSIDFKILRSKKEDISETSKNCCNECGGMMNEEGMCYECGSMMNESKKKKTLRLTESELVILIEKMVKESSIPTVTTRAQSESKKDNDSNIEMVSNKMKDYLSIPGNSNSEFPHQNKKGHNVKVSQTSEEEEKITDEKGRGMENLNYDHEPSEKFKDRLKKALEGDSTMGNGQDAANVVKSDLGKKVEKEVVRKKEDKEKEPLYKKERVPVSVNESEEKSKQILKEEIEKMKALSSYNKKTQ